MASRQHPSPPEAGAVVRDRLLGLFGLAQSRGSEQLRERLGRSLRITPLAAAGLALVALLGLGWAAWFGFQSSPSETSPTRASVQVSGSVATSGHPSISSGSSAQVVVDVAGRVRRPGLVRLPAGSRVADALAAAGGALPGVDLATINLARVVVDGEQVLVAVGGAAAPANGGASGGSGGAVDLNTATLDQLESLPGVGPVLAQRILDWRTQHTRFSSVDELREVSGIGDKKFSDIAAKAKV